MNKMFLNAKYIGTDIHSLDYNEKYSLKIEENTVVVQEKELTLVYRNIFNFLKEWKIL